VVAKQIVRKNWLGFLNMLRQQHDDRRGVGKNGIGQLANFRAAAFWRQSVGQITFR